MVRFPCLVLWFALHLCVMADSSSSHAFEVDDIEPDVLAAVNLAKSLSESGRRDDAVATLDSSIRQHSKAGVLYLMRAILQQKAGHDRVAVDDFSKAIEFEHLPALAYASRGLSRERLGDRLGAIADLDIAIQKDPTLAMAYFVRGIIYLNDEELPLAKRDLTKSIDLDANVESYTSRARCHIEMGDYSAACVDATRAIKIDPTNPSPIYIRANAHFQRGDLEAALADRQAAEKLEANITP